MTRDQKIAALQKKIASAEDKAADAYVAYRRDRTEENRAAWRKAMAEWNRLIDALEPLL